MFKRNRTPQNPADAVRQQIATLQTEHRLNEVDQRGLMNRPKYVQAKSTLVGLGTAGIPTLLEVLGEQRDDLMNHNIGVGTDVIEVLGKIGDTSCVAPVRALLGRTVGVEFALAEMPGGVGLPALLDGVVAPESFIRSSAAGGLGYTHSRSDEVLTALLNALGDPDHFVRAAAATAIGNLGFVEPRLTGALSVTAQNDDHDMVQRAASRALDELARK